MEGWRGEILIEHRSHSYPMYMYIKLGDKWRRRGRRGGQRRGGGGGGQGRKRSRRGGEGRRGEEDEDIN